MTFSIVAYDEQTGEIALGVASKVLAVGNLFQAIKAGVGAVASQSLVNVSLGPIGIELMEKGEKPEQIMEHFREIDKGIELRQLGIYSIKHGPYSFTGKQCIDWAGGVTGKDFACQGNILTDSEVIKEMADAFSNAPGELGERVITALIAANNAGGDARGQQSAALFIEQAGKGRANYGDRKIDIRVDDHNSPIQELKRIYEVSLLGEHMQETMMIANNDLEKAITFLEGKISGNKDRTRDEAWLLLAQLYFNNKQFNKAKACLNLCFQAQPGMVHIFKDYPKMGFGFSQEFVDEYLGNN